MGAHFVDAACRRGDRCLFFAFEESPQQIVRNMQSIGLDLSQWIKKGLLRIEAARPSAFGLEMHLVRMHHLLASYNPKVVIIDPISGLIPTGSEGDVESLVLRIVDYIKQRGATALFTSLSDEDDLQTTSLKISSLVDTWILLRNIEANGERNRVLYVLKSRGMAHSHQIREFLLSSRGVTLREVYLGPGGVLTGSARMAREAEERREEERQRHEGQRREMEAKRSLRLIEAKIAALEAERESHEKELVLARVQDEAQQRAALTEREALNRSRGTGSGNRAKGMRPNGRNVEF
jgi:circadian clock protein KaiC